MNKVKIQTNTKTLFLTGLLCLCILNPFSKNLFLLNAEEQSPFELSLGKDSLFLTSSFALNTTVFFLEKNQAKIEPDLQKLSQINFFDRWAAFPYSKPLDITGDIFQYTSILLPALLLTTDNSQWFTIGLMYLETMSFAYGFKNLGKLLVNRYRPYMYFENYPENQDQDFRKSFPSGHTSLSFAGASFLSYVYSSYFPESKWKIPIIAGSYALASSTAILRIASGNHFPTDVLTGALIGSLCGIAIPYFHKAETKISSLLPKNMQIHLNLQHISLQFSL